MQRRTWFIAGALAAIAIGAAWLSMPTTTNAALTDTDGDGASDLAEEVLGSDAADPSSTPETADYRLSTNLYSCGDGTDNDGDGSTDTEDTGCTDADDDGLSDGLELRLGSDPNNDLSFPEDRRLYALLTLQGFAYFKGVCTDGEDEDGDGLIDAEDPGCAPLDGDGDGFDDIIEKFLGADWENPASVPEHVSINPGSCSDAADNDGDTLVDAADPGCVTGTNDNLADAFVVPSLPYTYSAKVTTASLEPGEVQSSCSLVEPQERSTVWFKLTAPSDGIVVIDPTGSDLLVGVAVWQQAGTGLTNVDCISSFPDYLAGPVLRLAFHAVAGSAYYVQVERYVENTPELDIIDTGRLSVTFSQATPPSNDDFAAATQIDTLPFTTSVDTIAAGVEANEPDATCRYQGDPTNSVWYRYTPASDQYVSITTTDLDFGVTLGLFEGGSLATLDQVACGDTGLAFHASAGHTYYLQAAGYRCTNLLIGTASFCLDSRGGLLSFRMETFELPSCPAPQFTLPDPIGDVPDDPDGVDITSVSFAYGDEYTCFTVEGENVHRAGGILGWLEIDTDSSLATGSSYEVPECAPFGIGWDMEPRGSGFNEGLLLESEAGYITSTATSFTIMVPTSTIGDDTLRFGVLALNRVGTNSGSWSDCAPNGGNITCTDGACAFMPYRNGDANCSGPADAIDAAIVLQYGAGLLDHVGCPTAADINGDSAINSLDAALILQFVAGLIGHLPPSP